jgi:hypothetical protein
MSIRLLIVLVALLIPARSQGQLFSPESGNCENIQGVPISLWPQIELDMPLKVMASYIVADTLCRTFTENELTEIVHSLSDDSVAIGLKSLIAVQDYDYLRYIHLQDFSWQVKPEFYKTDYMAIERVLTREYFTRVAPADGFDSIRMYNRGPIVLAKVLNVGMHLDSSLIRMSHPGVSEVYCADIQLLSSIFGATNPSFCYPDTEESGICVFGISWSSPPADKFSRYIRDYTYQEYGPGRLQTGNTYIIWTDMWIMKTEGNILTYSVFPKVALPVEDNIVHDKYNWTGLGEYVPLDTYVSTLRNGILKIGN